MDSSPPGLWTDNRNSDVSPWSRRRRFFPPVDLSVAWSEPPHSFFPLWTR